MPCTPEEKQALLALARATVQAAVLGENLDSQPVLTGCERLSRELCGVFVTLNKKKRLRGCIGLMESMWPVTETVRKMAAAAAMEDPRFPAVMPGELKDISIEISILTPLTRVYDIDKIELGKDGVLIRQGNRSGVFLPQVAHETGWDLDTFLNELCVRKAGLAPRAWENKGAEVYCFQVENFKEC